MSTPSIYGGSSTLDNITFRILKGFNYEKCVGRKLRDAGFSFRSNNLNSITEWMKQQGRGADFVISGIEIEAKFSHAKIYPSWIERDWIPRFTKNVKHKIIVTNRGIQLSEYSKCLLRKHKIKHVFFDELVSYLRTILHSITKPLHGRRGLAFSGKRGGNKVPSNRLHRYLKGLANGITPIPSKVATTFNRYKSVIIRYVVDRVNDVSRLFQGRITVYNIYWVMAAMSFIQLVLLTFLEVK
jgi:hypothetical protein